ASVRDFRSGIVATTRSLRAASASEASAVSPTINAVRIDVKRCIPDISSILEGVRRVRAQDERGLEEQLVHDSRRSVIGGEQARTIALGVLVTEAEAQKLRGEEAHVGADRPLESGTVGELRGVVARTERPPAKGLQLAVQIPAKGVARLADRIQAL